MIKIVILGLLAFSVQGHAFSDVGTSKKGCQSAKRDAQVIAQSHCYSLDTKPKISFGSCQKRKVGGKLQFRVPVRYNCQIQTAKFDY